MQYSEVGINKELHNPRILGGRMEISKTLEKFQEVKERMRKAIISKGVVVKEGASLSEMADKILEIKIEGKKKEKKHV